MKKRRRTIPLMFYVTPEERDQIEAKMAQLGTNNMSAYGSECTVCNTQAGVKFSFII